MLFFTTRVEGRSWRGGDGNQGSGAISNRVRLFWSSELIPTFINHKEAPYTRLADLFSEHKFDQTKTTDDDEGTQQPNEELSDVLLDYYAKHRNPDSECLSHPNDPLPSEPVPGSHDGHFDESPPDKCKNDQSILSDRTDKGTVKMPVIHGLLDLLREQQCASSISTSGNNKKGRLVKENALIGNLQISDNNNNNRLTSWDFHDGTSENDDEETSNSDIVSVDFADAKASSEVSVPMRDKDERQLKGTSFSREEHGTKNGVTKALKKSGSCINRWVITVESATSIENVKIPMPDLTGDHDVPAALVKNPTRTIKIEQLSREISLCHIKEALAFCDCNVSGYYMGSSHSVAYVEFETEIGKERALAKQSINVLGKHLTMLRIDPPRTTVVRISTVRALGMSKILSVCRPLGVVRQSIQRNYYVVDVHFGLAEWPNMLKILNR
ncbi:hypothetical protein PHJA_000727600 [Phtheirospermum japonicum]|uniref:Uncharacterized protein n=1 Tax=Phtheirospermum japonicum TaxID=374723 RepID=A0A830BLC7_9LAMI|nr:hypothetical protein PHJA_000727600 [Phtheirospermum japonicum]